MKSVLAVLLLGMLSADADLVYRPTGQSPAADSTVFTPTGGGPGASAVTLVLPTQMGQFLTRSSGSSAGSVFEDPKGVL